MKYETLSAEYVDDHLSVLAQRHCRYVLYYFQETTDDVASIEDLVADLRSRDSIDDESITRTLHHATLPSLEAVGAVEYDERNGTVRYYGHPVLERWLSFLADDEQAASRLDPDSGASQPAAGSSTDTVRETYEPERDRTLTDAVLDAIEECKGDDLSLTDFTLFDDIDPNALDAIFKENAEPGTTLSFSTDNVRVELWGDGGVEIRVSR